MMLSSTHRYSNLVAIALLFSIQIQSQDSFPDWSGTDTFRADLKYATLLTNHPNPTGTNQYLGLSSSLASGVSESNQVINIPSARLSIYPNPGYNIWVQLAKWSFDDPDFSIGTGIQVEFPGDDPHTEQAIGIVWNQLFSEEYSQRDISIYALFNRFFGKLSLGMMGLVDMHHVLVTDGKGISDYDELLYHVLPYLSYNFMKNSRIYMLMPVNEKSATLKVSLEWLLGDRK